MDYVPAHGNTNMLEDRDETSGARVFDGEDQGKFKAIDGKRQLNTASII